MKLDSILRRLVKKGSWYPSEGNVTAFLIDFLRGAHFLVQTQTVAPGRKNIFAQKNTGQASILFYGHQDTVPMTHEDEWNTPPLSLKRIGGNYYGLGASDMKGGIAAFLEATKNTNTYVKIFLAVDEENISEGAWKAVQEKKDFFEDVELIISAEPNFGLGLHGMTTGRTGRCVYEVRFQGKSEHITRYREAVDAIEKLGDFISTLYAKRGSLFASKDTVAQIRKLEGESVGMTVCGDAKAEVEVLLGSEDSVENVRQTLQEIANSEVVPKPRKTPYLEGYQFDRFPYQKIIATIIEENTGKKMTLHTRQSVGDDNVLATLKIPVITWGPSGGNEHRSNEYVVVHSLEILTKMYKELLHHKKI